MNNIDNALLQSFVGGIWYFRWPCWETGPDWWYLFRSKILNIRITGDSGLAVLLEDLLLNRFMAGSWINHPSEPEEQVFKPNSTMRKGERVIIPDYTIISPTIIVIKLDEVAEAVMYANESEQPDDLHCFVNFPEGYESMAGLGGF
ncbi:MAG: hypothetical protein WCV55_03000 [Candidatus Paceibacterota bacterium]